MKNIRSFKTIALIGRADIPDLRELLILLARCIRKRGFEVVCEAQTAQAARLTEYSLLSASEIGTRADVAVVIGGDGTMLGMGRQLAPYGTPLIGVNRGRLGFVTDIPIRDMLRVVPVMLEGRFEREERTLLDARVLRKGSPVYHALAFNDVVVNRSGISGMVELSVYVDDCFMYRQRSDGLIAATPTGSTAYALSSQGPILHPQLAGIVLVPIAPHTLSNRPIVLPDHARIAIQIVDGRFDKVCGAIGTSTMPANCGCRIGPCDDKAYAVEPVGVAAISPSERCRYIKQSSTYTLSSTMPEMPLRFTTTSLKASA